MAKDTDQSQPSGPQPANKASAEKIRADLDAAGLMRLLDTPPHKAARAVQEPGSNVVPFRRVGDKSPIRTAFAPAPVAKVVVRRNWQRVVAPVLYALLAGAIAFLLR
jgi:hypothetical protein